MIKSYVIDTNILIQAPYACQCFEENRVILPLVVLEELDGLKKAEGEKGANARRAIRFLEKLRMKGDLLKGVELENGGFLRVEANCVGVELPENLEGKMAIVDGYEGKLILDADEETLCYYEKKKEEEEEEKKLLLNLKGKETETTKGKKIHLYANIGGMADLASVLANDAAGIGLFRSEFLYLESDKLPTEEEQFKVYKAVAETMAGKKVIIRTLDIGADKKVDYLNLEAEENPAMGYRAIRICLDQPELFKTQLRAIYRASYYGNIGIMFPMIISLEEIKKIKEIVAEVKAELKDHGILYGDVELGIMIETPAAVMISDKLAEEVEFFSIGTNDLTQYTLAMDRQNPKLESFYDPHHEAILRMIEMTVENGHKHQCWVGICGELGADLSLTETFIHMGIDELSVTPSMVLKVRDTIRKI